MPVEYVQAQTTGDVTIAFDKCINDMLRFMLLVKSGESCVTLALQLPCGTVVKVCVTMTKG